MMSQTLQSRERSRARHSDRSHETVSCLRRVRHAAARWFAVLILALVGAIAFEWILPIGWRFTGCIETAYSPWFLMLATVVVTSVLLCVLLEPIHFRWRHLANIGWYPPTWVALAFGLPLAATLERLAPADSQPQTLGLDWQQPTVLVPIAIAIMGVLLFRLLTHASRKGQSPETTLAPSSEQESRDENQESTDIRYWLSDSERPIGRSKEDLFGRDAVSVRIATRLLSGQSVALLGPLGSGKSSVLNLVRTRLGEAASTPIVVAFDVWAVPRPEDVPHLALTRIIDALNGHVDMIGLRDVPATYQRLVMAAPVSNLSKTLGLDIERNSIGTLQRLVPILEVLNTRLVLIVEDTDRTGATFDTRHLERLLWALHDLQRTTFVLAFDPNHGPHTDFTKICDTVERLDALQDTDVATVVSAAVHYWTSEYSDIEPRLRQTGKLGLQYTQKGGIFEYMYRINVDRPLRYMAQTLQTPREFKRVLQRVNVAWRHLHGEVDLEDLLIVTTFRECLPSVYGFLLEHIDAARRKADEGPLGSSAIKDDWNQLLKTFSNPQSAKRLVALLGIAQLSAGQGQPADESPQGVHLTDPTDYLDRIHAEGIDSNEIRDQSVLRDINAWEQDRTESLIENLAVREGGKQRYAAVWEHFAFRHTHEGLSHLMVRLVHGLVRSEGLKLTMNHPALLAMWRECNRQLLNEQNREWLQSLILDVVPENLSFSIDLYHDLTGGKLPIVRAEEREEIRSELVKTIQKTILTDSDLVRHLSGVEPRRISAMISKTAPDTGSRPVKTWDKYLAPILANGADHYPEQFLPELATLLATPRSNERTTGGEPPSFPNPYEFDHARTESLLGKFLDPTLARLAGYKGDNTYALRARREAAKWLQERRDSAQLSQDADVGDPSADRTSPPTSTSTSSESMGASQLRRRYASEDGSYRTDIRQEPKVWHTDPDCPAGQQIDVQNLRGGHGDKKRVCALCKSG